MTPCPKTFRRWCRLARKRWPLKKPVRVRRRVIGSVGIVETAAYCRDMGAYYIIVIHSGLGRQAVSDALLHEWCHLVRGEIDTTDEEGLHDDAFWKQFGKMFKVWHNLDE